jgi:hypothetical protein
LLVAVEQALLTVVVAVQVVFLLLQVYPLLRVQLTQLL